jgi:hypothetical protein
MSVDGACACSTRGLCLILADGLSKQQPAIICIERRALPLVSANRVIQIQESPIVRSYPVSRYPLSQYAQKMEANKPALLMCIVKANLHTILS